MQARVIFLEGLPGTGKTTTAQAIHRWYADRDLAASWWLEETPDHPATPKDLRRTASTSGFAERCLAHWAHFARENQHGSGRLVLEGSAFQSTIRFMLEYGLPREEILGYVREFETLCTPLAPWFVYLEPAEGRAFLSEFVYRIRGPAWVNKVSAYLASTPCARERGWSGPAGMLEFWLLYQELCEEALSLLRQPVLRLTIGPGRWADAHAKLFAWLPFE